MKREDLDLALETVGRRAQAKADAMNEVPTNQPVLMANLTIELAVVETCKRLRKVLEEL